MLIFGLQQLLPGDPAVVLAGEDHDPERRRVPASEAASRRAVAHPLPVLDQRRAARRPGRIAAHAEAGAGADRREAAGDTSSSACFAILIALAIGVPPASSAAVRRNSVWDYAANGIAFWGLSTPNFWLGFMLILFVSVTLGLLPASGYVSPRIDRDSRRCVMPSFVLGITIAAVLMRHTRSAMLHGSPTTCARRAPRDLPSAGCC